MHITTIKEKLLRAILMVERIAGKKETLPILSCALIDVGKEISIRSTNLEAALEVRVPGDIEGRGIVAVPVSVLSQTIRSVMGDKVILRVDEGNLILESRGSKTLIKAIPYEEFPSFPKVGSSGGVPMIRTDLLQGLQSVSYAASPSMIRPELGSVYVSLGEGSLACVATDSFRLAEKIIFGKNKGGPETLIPLRHTLELIHVLEHIDDEGITLVVEESQLAVLGEGVRFTSRVVEGNFPNYKEIIPKKFSTEATILKADFVEMLRKARVFSGNDQHVGFHVYPKRKVFSATARSQDIGETSDTIDAALSGEDLDINFHIGYLADCLPIIMSDSITLGFSGPGKPLVIHGVSDSSFTYLVMPLNR